jgi:hypothetical protein
MQYLGLFERGLGLGREDIPKPESFIASAGDYGAAVRTHGEGGALDTNALLR